MRKKLLMFFSFPSSRSPAVARKVPLMRWRVSGALLVMIFGALAQAQQVVFTGLPMVKKNPLQMDSATIVVSHKTQTVILHLTNPTKDTVYVELSAQYAAPVLSQPQTDAVSPTSVARGLLAGSAADSLADAQAISRDSLRADSLRRERSRIDSLGRQWSLASWLTELPKQDTILPHVTKTITLHVAVPATLPSGEYTAYLMARVLTETSMSMTMSGFGGNDAKTDWNSLVVDGQVFPVASRVLYQTDRSLPTHESSPSAPRRGNVRQTPSHS